MCVFAYIMRFLMFTLRSDDANALAIAMRVGTESGNSLHANQ